MLAGCAAAAKTNLVPAAASSKLTVTVLDVGQGDAILVQTDGKNVLVDAGPRENSGKLVRSLKSNGVTRIDILIATHPHADHIGGMGALLEAFGVGKVYDTGQLTAAKTYGNFLKTIKSKKIQLALLRAPSRIPIGREGAALEVIMPQSRFCKQRGRTEFKQCRYELVTGTFQCSWPRMPQAKRRTHAGGLRSRQAEGRCA
jgi:competence protein ComEC